MDYFEILAKTQEHIPTAQELNEKSAQSTLRYRVGVDVIKENDELRDRVAELQDKVNALEMELAAEKKKELVAKVVGERFWWVS